jgi:hypothetical protein
MISYGGFMILSQELEKRLKGNRFPGMKANGFDG